MPQNTAGSYVERGDPALVGALSLLRDVYGTSPDAAGAELLDREMLRQIRREKLASAIQIIEANVVAVPPLPITGFRPVVIVDAVNGDSGASATSLAAAAPPPTRQKIQDALDFSRSWIGAFVGTAVTLWIFKGINEANSLDPDRLLVLPGSFGALATIVYCLPHMPTAQPWPVFHCHSLGMFVSVVLSFVYRSVFCIPRGSLAWFEIGFSVATASKLTSHVSTSGGVTHPLAGGVAFFVANYTNTDTYSHSGLGYLVLSVYMGLFVFISVTTLFSNFDVLRTERKRYPQDTIPADGWGRSFFAKVGKL